LHIADFRGEFKENYPIARMLFDDEEMAQSFIKDLNQHLGISKTYFYTVTATGDKTALAR